MVINLGHLSPEVSVSVSAICHDSNILFCALPFRSSTLLIAFIPSEFLESKSFYSPGCESPLIFRSKAYVLSILRTVLVNVPFWQTERITEKWRET